MNTSGVINYSSDGSYVTNLTPEPTSHSKSQDMLNNNIHSSSIWCKTAEFDALMMEKKIDNCPLKMPPHTSIMQSTISNKIPAAASTVSPQPAVAPLQQICAKELETIFNSKISFPLNLTYMLESVESMGKSHIIHWMANKKSFVIYDIDLFLSEVLPLFFK